MQYLKSGIQDMLESRLSQDENVIVISDEKITEAMEGIQEPIDENEAREIGQRLSADYVLIGSLTVFGSSASLDARLVDSAGEKETIAFFEQSESIDDLVPKINQFATDVTGNIAGGAAAVALGAGTTPPAPAPTEDVREHPEKMAEETPQAENSGVSVAAAEGVPSDAFWKSRRFKILMNGLALGDVDGDGKTETVIITPDSVIVYRNDKNKMFKTGEFKTDRYKILIGVDVADINGNGYAEIFITAQNTQKNRVYSGVYEYNGKTFSPIVTDSPWKFRVVIDPQGKPVLLGQKHIAKKPFSGAVYKLHWDAGEYQTGDQVAPGIGYNLMGFAYGDATNTDENSVVAYDEWDKMMLIAATGEVLWKHSHKTGGSSLKFSIGFIGPDEEGFQYLPMRILIKDTDKDGQNEVIAVKNYDAAKGALAHYRYYQEAEIHSYYWDGVGLTPKWKTKKISGYMRDIAIGDHNNDGKIELVVALVLQEGRIAGTTPKSILIAYQF